jgi:glucose-6-phosphate 1-dehydrogenase
VKTKIVIFGITGDLSTRKLLPALDAIVKTAEVNDLSIVGVSRRDVDINELLQDQPRLIDRTAIFTMDLAASDDYVRLSNYLALDSDTQALIYLSVPPSAAADIVDFLGVAGINTSNVKILFEKPFGFDLESAREVIDRTARYFSETQLYRIDHYMAKDVAQEVIRLRSNAENHHHGWGANTITSIAIVASEKIGVEGRGVFYEQTGALRDVIQGHLMQLLSLVLMDIPTDFSLDNLPHYRKQALDHVRLLSLEGVRRSQYRGYQQEVTNIGSQTETFTAITFTSEHSRWKDVTLSLVTGKNLADKRTYLSLIHI